VASPEPNSTIRQLPVCGALIDMRDLGQILAHVHDAEIEIGEGPEPPAKKEMLLPIAGKSARRRRLRKTERSTGRRKAGEWSNVATISSSSGTFVACQR